MPDYSSIETLLQQMEITVAAAIIEDSSAPGHYFVRVAVTRDARNRQKPSNKKLNEARQTLAKAGFGVDFLLNDSQTQDIEAGLRATILHGYGAQIRNVYMSTRGKSANVWLDPKRTLDQAILKKIGDSSKRYLSVFGIDLGSLAITTGQDLPGVLPCLRTLRQIAPADIPDLSNKLVQRGFKVPSDDWLKRRLDLMRRSGQVLRVEGSRYVLTMEGIRKLGTTKNRTSPDIARLLALARGGL
ncbi:MAG: hypothetical protein G3I10_09505 [Ferrovum sp.]|nr:hypothetical protein [Ferrovum sp.]